MIDFNNIILERMAIHKVGNKAKGTENFFSEKLYKPSPAVEDKLLKYFLDPLKKTEDTFHFQHHQTGSNQLFNLASAYFLEKENFLEKSTRIARHLFDQSKHPNIKSGEVFVVHFSELLYGDEMADAIGIFKCERKNNFMQVNQYDSELLLNFLKGINVDKMDKGCLIINVEQEDGLRILSVDNNSYDAAYWLNDFLQVGFVKDDFYHTRSYLEMVDNFSKEVLAPQADRQEQIQFMNDSVDYFAKHPTFNFDDFAESVTPNESVAAELRNYQSDFNLESVNDFPIAPAAINIAKKKIKNDIKLDTGVQIKMNAKEPDVSKKYVERGFDESKGMYFYKVFFNEEIG